ncbi:hypothetical protein MMC20_004885 [Loxospora ochrophaea]|nr:hypothetical protein [Loxospora ochrophaea]
MEFIDLGALAREGLTPDFCLEELEEGLFWQDSSPETTLVTSSSTNGSSSKLNENSGCISGRNESPDTLGRAAIRHQTDPDGRICLPPRKLQKLPDKKNCKAWRGLRHNLLAVYQRLFSVVCIANMIAFIVLLTRHHTRNGPPLSSVADASSANILCAILIRQEYVINALYKIALLTPRSAPLRLRRVIAKIYHFGGIHSGCGAASSFWLILFAVLLTRQWILGIYRNVLVLVITYILVLLLLSLAVFAVPKFRFKSHNTFENVHRLAGWLSLALFWILLPVLANSLRPLAGDDSLGVFLAKTPAFWFLLVASLCIIRPWLQLKKVRAYPERLSSHAIRLRFNYTDIGIGVGIRITHSPLKEWHAFASIPDPDGKSFSLLVSNAGDWTKKQIENPAEKYYTRGIPTIGVLIMANIFRKVVVVTTGSGIGPVLSFCGSYDVPRRLLWSTPSPMQTFGEGIVNQVLKLDPDAMVIDTRKTGRPDMVALAHHLYVESGAEAVFVISNPSLTYKLVFALESRGIPAFAPIFDS